MIANSLQPPVRPVRCGRVTSRQSMLTLLSALVAVLSVLAATSLATWHGAKVHNDHAQVSVLEQDVGDHGDRAKHDPSPGDQGGSMHSAAHMVELAADMAAAGPATAAAAVTDGAWAPHRKDPPKGLEPPSLLRPPRA